MRFIDTEALARRSARHPWRTVVVWLCVIGLAVGLSAALLGGALTTDADFTNQPESKRAAALLEEARGPAADPELVVVTGDTMTAADPAYRAFLTDLASEVATLSGVAAVTPGPVSPDGRSALMAVTLAGTEADVLGDQARALREAVAAIEAPAGLEAIVTGSATLDNEFNEIAEEDLAKGETIGLGVALVVLILVFGAVVAGLVPIVLGISAIAVALGGAALVGQLFDLSFFVTNMITMIGLAVGIDYSLFVVSRYREERRGGMSKLDAVTRAGATASRAVLWSGLTVVLALVGMLLVPNTIFRSLGIGAILVVVIAVAASLTLLPAVLALLGDRIDTLRIRGRRRRGGEGRFWDRLSGAVMRRPVLSLLASAGLLLVLALPYLSINTGFAGVSTFPDDIESKRAFTVLAEDFAGGLASPVEIVVDGAAPDGAVEGLVAALAADPGFGQAVVAPVGDLTVISVPVAGDPMGDDALEAVRELRAETIPAAFGGSGVEALVGGDTAVSADLVAQTSRYTPIVFGFVLGLSFLLLMVAFRSVVIPVKAILMNLLSVGAAYGAVVLFFQAGAGPAWVKSIAGWLGFTQVDAIEAWLPLFLFSVLFGLSMDYHVFLLSRIRERFDHTGDNAGSVAYGLRTTGALITGAAAIMVAVFGGFAAGRLVSMQQMGFGLAVAVLLDATIVRSVLVPASMRLLGDRNWYLPRWLGWLPRVDVEGARLPEPAPEPAVA